MGHICFPASFLESILNASVLRKILRENIGSNSGVYSVFIIIPAMINFTYLLLHLLQSAVLVLHTYCALFHLTLKTMLKIKDIIPFYTRG